MKSTHRVLCHSLLRSPARSHRSLIRMLRAALRSFVCSLARSLTQQLMGKRFLSLNSTRRFHSVSAHCASELFVRNGKLPRSHGTVFERQRVMSFRLQEFRRKFHLRSFSLGRTLSACAFVRQPSQDLFVVFFVFVLFCFVGFAR